MAIFVAAVTVLAYYFARVVDDLCLAWMVVIFLWAGITIRWWLALRRLGCVSIGVINAMAVILDSFPRLERHAAS